MAWALLKNSLMVSAIATLAAAGMGFAAALCMAALPRGWRQGGLVGAGIALALPPFLVTDTWLRLLGQTGLWRSWLPFNIYSLGGATWILALLTWPLAFFFVLGTWQRLEPAWLESDPALTGGALIRHVLWPLARPALVCSSIIVFVLALNNFAVPAILQVKVLPAELWVNFNTTFNYATAIRLCWPLVVAPLVMLVWLSGRELRWPRIDGPVSACLFRSQLGTLWFGVTGVVTALTLLLAVGLPLAQLASNRDTWQQIIPALKAGKTACWNSFFYATAAASVCVTVGLLGRGLRLRLLAWIPFLAPGVLLGIALIYLLNRPPFVAFYQSAGVVVFAWTIRYLAFAWHGAAHARRSLDPDLTDAARLDGASAWQLFRHVHWPQMAPLLAVAWYVTYVFCLWDVETLILIVPPGGETLALRIFNLLHYGWNAQVNALCLVLLLLAVLPLLLWWAGRGLIAWTTRALTPLMYGPQQRSSVFVGRAIRLRLRFTWSLRSYCLFDPVAASPHQLSAVLLCAAALAAGVLFLTGCGPQATSDSVSLKSKLFSRAQVIGSRGTGAGQFNKPRSVAVDRHDNLYVVDMTARVQKFDPQGNFLTSWQMEFTDKGKPKGMDCDGSGNIIVVEPHYSRINHFSTEGKFLFQWGTNGTNFGQLGFPRAIAVNSHGELWVSEYGPVERIQRFTADGKQCLRSLGQLGSGAGQFNRAEGLGVDRQDRLYVADSCNHRIQLFTPEGKLLRTYGRAGDTLGELSYPYDVRVDASGNQCVCEFGNSRIQVFDPHDRAVETIGKPGSSPGEFNNPWSIALDSKGNLYVADSGNHRVVKLIRRSPLSVATRSQPPPNLHLNPLPAPNPRAHLLPEIPKSKLANSREISKFKLKTAAAGVSSFGACSLNVEASLEFASLDFGVLAAAPRITDCDLRLMDSVLRTSHSALAQRSPGRTTPGAPASLPARGACAWPAEMPALPVNPLGAPARRLSNGLGSNR